jgi:hypothetical protein
LELIQFFQGVAAGTLEGVEAGLEALEAGFEDGEGVGEGVSGAEMVVVVFGIEVFVPALEVLGVEVGLGQTEAADEPLVVDKGVDEVALARGGGEELGVVFGCELGESGGVFATDDEGFGVEAGLESVAAGVEFAFGGARAGGFLRIAAIRFDLGSSSHAVQR